ncbi:Hypothetical predicted protein [Paramuricea clavata]|uniref:Uncharacterized protein n=1 Tax=Paramuricea clavata TaxID=317549 RepID=A0A6S7LLG4_PARCT|nr:Hypothetical predicted protein [Paramuricea clavata]
MASFQAEFSDHSDREEELEDMLTSTTNEVQIQKRVFNIEDEEATVIPKKIPAKNLSLLRSRNILSFFQGTSGVTSSANSETPTSELSETESSAVIEHEVAVSSKHSTETGSPRSKAAGTAKLPKRDYSKYKHVCLLCAKNDTATARNSAVLTSGGDFQVERHRKSHPLFYLTERHEIACCTNKSHIGSTKCKRISSTKAVI